MLEELGLTVRMRSLLAVDHRSGTTRRPEYIRFLFDGGVVDTDLSRMKIQREEIDDVHVVSLEESRPLLTATLA
ncbi:MAG: hypothetical protein ACR2H3_06020 [Acidimicrobiales bacterium]